MISRLLTLCLLAVALSSCTFHRVQSNAAFRELEMAPLRVGESTWRDVLETFGPPSGSTTQKIRAGLSGVSTFRYASADERHTSFLLAAILYLPFKWSDDQIGRELVVEFDANGVVSDMYEVEEESVWRPLYEVKTPEDRSVIFASRPGDAP